ncbi:uncharacterized protein PHALS_01003 [Plasmopara halstedii]|uniref:Uncharacterized protein n=1 Tax=Plasmopara halstedii TaxID=4781 RepID=A0A0P1ATV1_PLAHL|nr:uncharacterized protein PHALS_01003 [Plasmopara halstedii]CEG44656.1 hypothetical protein PHALS_01003 [Plasmopara halstedii]|eukprot:XP_024581025.1 hypothetical protein PHALS_01003 [Plasmopara halstedii]
MMLRVQQFFHEATGDGSLSFDTFTVVLRVLDKSNDSTASDKVKNSETLTAFFTAQSQHDQWMNAFAKGINYAKSRATLRDEKGILTPWQMSGSHIRIAANSQMKATVLVDAVLIGYRLRCYSSQEATATAASISALSQDLTLSVDTRLSLLISKFQHVHRGKRRQHPGWR